MNMVSGGKHWGHVRPKLARAWKFLLLCIPDRYYLAVRYRWKFGCWPDYDHPRHFNEFTHAYMLHCREPVLQLVADKFLVRSFITEQVGERYLVPLLGIWDRPADVDFSALRPPYVLKDTLGNNRNIFVWNVDDVDGVEIRRHLAEWLQAPYWRYQREWAYRGRRSRIIAELILESEKGGLPHDYKLYVIGGKVQFIQVDRDRFSTHTRNLYSREWSLLPVQLSKMRHEPDPVPAQLDEMLWVAEKIGDRFEFLRVDFYLVENRLYIGELTNYSGAGFETFVPESFGTRLGDAWRTAKARRNTIRRQCLSLTSGHGSSVLKKRP